MSKKNRMKLVMIYLTRKCPRQCAYCSIKDNHFKNELNVEQWKRVMHIINDIGTDFVLIIGNEPWLLGEDLPKILNELRSPFAMYTTALPVIFEKYREYFFENGIDNLSCGIDYPYSYVCTYMEKNNGVKNVPDDVKKAYDGWNALLWTKKHYPDVDLHIGVTVSLKNYRMLPEMVTFANEVQIPIGMNFIHWNIDGRYDFFPRKEFLKGYVFDFSNKQLIEDVSDVFEKIMQIDQGYIHNNFYFRTRDSWKRYAQLKYHCNGSPYKGLTIDADGSLRVCGYRQGTQTSKYSIFDVERVGIEKIFEAIYADAMKCPGCGWGCSAISNEVEEDKVRDTYVYHYTPKKGKIRTKRLRDDNF